MVGKHLAQNPTFPSMNGLIDRIVGIEDSLDRREGIVEICLPDLLAVAVDVVETGDGVAGYKVRGYAGVAAVLLMDGVEP